MAQPLASLSVQCKVSSTLSSFIRLGQLDKAIKTAESLQVQGTCLTRDQAYQWLRECSKHQLDVGYVRRLQSLLVFSRLDSVQVLVHHLIRQFTSCRSLVDADLVFNRVLKPNAYAWSAIISAHANLGKADTALCLYHKMMILGTQPDRYVFLAVLKACKAFTTICLVHDHIIQCGLETVVMVVNAMIDLYAKCDNLEDSYSVYAKLNPPDVVSCNSMIAAYTHHGHISHALDCFKKMQCQDIKPDDVTFSSVLIACAEVGAIKQGRLIHHHIVESGLHSYANVGTSLLDMYGKSGSLADSANAFIKLPHRDVVAWGALISGCVQCGESDVAMKYFNKMEDEGFKPNEVTFTSILAACSNAGLVNEGCLYLQLMISKYKLKPSTRHCFCVMDLLARAGRLDEAESLIQTMDSSPIVAWRSLLTACKTYGNVDLGRCCFDHVLHIDPRNASSYTLMARIYLDAGMIEEAKYIESMRRSVRVWFMKDVG